MILRIFLLLLAIGSKAFMSKAQGQQVVSFPYDFTGHWKGTLHWYPAGKPVQSVEMRLLIQPSDSAGCYQWKLVYGSEGRDSRPYLLRPVDTTIGHWLIDERNGILLDGYWRGYRFTNVFSVQGNVVLAVYWLEDGHIQVEMITYASQSIRNSGDKGPEIPPVSSYPVRSYQRATLQRME